MSFGEGLVHQSEKQTKQNRLKLSDTIWNEMYWKGYRKHLSYYLLSFVIKARIKMLEDSSCFG